MDVGGLLRQCCGAVLSIKVQAKMQGVESCKYGRDFLGVCWRCGRYALERVV